VFSAADLRKQTKAGGGKEELKTAQGETLTAMMDGGKIVLKDRKGGMAVISIPDVFQSNGVIQVVDSVLSTRLINKVTRRLHAAPWPFFESRGEPPSSPRDASSGQTIPPAPPHVKNSRPHFLRARQLQNAAV